MHKIKCIRCGEIVAVEGDKTLCPECLAILKTTPQMRERTCRACGAKFIGGPRAWYCPTCRHERQKERDREIHRNGPARKLGSTDLCVICGKAYSVESPAQKYCKDCAEATIKAIARKQSVEYAKANREKMLARKKENHQKSHICQVCGKQTSTCNVTCSAFCAKCLKSYSQAMAQYRRGRRTMPTMDEIVAYQSRQSGVKGVAKSANGKRWIAHYHNKHLGTYDSVAEAAAAIEKYKKEEKLNERI